MRQWIAAVKSRRSVQRIVRFIRRYNYHDAARQGAALAYYLLFSLFPILILVSSLIGQLELEISGVLDSLAPVLPDGVLALVSAYLGYVSEHVSVSMLWFSAVFSVWFPMRATNCLMRAVRRAYDLGAPKRRVRYFFKVLFVTVLLLTTLVLSLLLATLGSRFANALGRMLSLSAQLTGLWGLLRFGVLGAVIFLALGALYAAAQDERRPLRVIVPGAVISALAWIVISSGYAFYAENIASYSAIYGALGAVVVLLIWLYLTAQTLIAGAEINFVLLHEKKTQRDDRFNQGEPL